MITIKVFQEELNKLIEENKKFLDDLKYYDVTSSGYMQVYIAQKVHQLEGILLQIIACEKDPALADINHLYQVFGELRSDIYFACKKWRLQVEVKYQRLKTKLGKLYYISSLGT